MNVLLFLLVGLATGSIAAKRTRTSMSVPLAVVIGALGALAGGFLLGGLGLAARGLFGSTLTATAGAFLSLLIAGLFLRST